MSVLFFILFTCLIVYALLLFWLATGFLKTQYYEFSGHNNPVPVTIIICARNEEKCVSLCLNTIINQEYDRGLIQVIFVNDASKDNTLALAQSILKKSGLDHVILSNEVQLGKKRSIINAMHIAKHELIVSRDADTFTRSGLWLRNLASFYQQNNCDMIIAPVAIADNYGLLWALQAVENNILVLAAAGSAFYRQPFLCSGANLAFTKTAFVKTGAYSTHINTASGDDVLFLEELKKIKDARIVYLKSKDAIVYTFPCYSLSDLIRQKTRWASKFKVNKNTLNNSLAVLSALVNLSWLFCLGYGFIKPDNNSATFLFIISKLIIDFLLLFLATGFIKNRFLLWFSLPVGFIYPLYTCIIAVAALTLKPKWK